MSKVYKLNDDDFKELVLSNHGYSDILRGLGLSPKGGSSSKVLKRRIQELDIDISHFYPINKKAIDSKRKNLEDILVENSTYTNISRLKKKLLSEKLIEYKCDICNNNGTWLGESLTLQLDHINGIYNDHRLCNLRFLCPNCHSQTPSYSGRNKGKGIN